MKNSYKKFLWVILLIFGSVPGFSQSNEIKIRFIGNCGLYLTDGDLNVYVDFPYTSGAYHYMEYDPSEVDSIKDHAIFLFTHRHADHYSRKLLSKLDGKIYGPWKVGKKRRLDISKPGYTGKDFLVQAFKTKHRFSLKHYSYLITWHNKKIFLSGDTEHAETIGKIKDMDWAFVPTWVLRDAKEKHINIDTEQLGVYHLYPDEKPGLAASENMIFLQKQKEVISLPY